MPVTLTNIEIHNVVKDNSVKLYDSANPGNLKTIDAYERKAIQGTFQFDTIEMNGYQYRMIGVATATLSANVGIMVFKGGLRVFCQKTADELAYFTVV